MVFSSPVFLFIFLTAVYILYRIVPTVSVKNTILLIFSLLFYTYGEPKAIILMIISNYRKLTYELDIQAVQEYAMQLPKTRLVLDTLQLEVF